MNYRLLIFIIVVSLFWLSFGLRAMERAKAKMETAKNYTGIYFAAPFLGSNIPDLLSGARESYKIQNEIKRLLIVQVCCGLGNRLRVIASAEIMGKLTNREVIIIWETIPNEMPAFYNELFEEPYLLTDEDVCPYGDTIWASIVNAPPNHPDIKNLGVQNDSAAFKVLSELPEYEERIIYFHTTAPFQPSPQYMLPREYFGLLRQYYNNLVPVKPVRRALKAFKRDNKFDEKYMIGVHYRAWDTGYADDRVSCLTKDKEFIYLGDFITEMKKALLRESPKTKNKPIAFFLTSDSSNLKTQFRDAAFEGRIITTSHEVDRSTTTGLQKDLLEWFLLGSTQYIIGTNESSFSDEAAYLTVEGKKISVGKAAFN
jgi:hypothetical protein